MNFFCYYSDAIIGQKKRDKSSTYDGTFALRDKNDGVKRRTQV